MKFFPFYLYWKKVFWNATLILCMILSSNNSFGTGEKTDIYLFPGQGSDYRLFDSLSFDTTYKVHHIIYGTPEKGMKMKEFAIQLIPQIDTTRKFILIGTSLGGMICSELNEIIDAEKVIIIASAKNKDELPFRYNFQKKLPLYKILPPRLLLLGAKVLQPIVEPDRNKNKETFKKMLGDKDPIYMKRTISLIIEWNKPARKTNIVHIHGDNDHTLPIRNINTDFVIEQGSHMMTLTRAKEVNVILNQVLQRHM